MKKRWVIGIISFSGILLILLCLWYLFSIPVGKNICVDGNAVNNDHNNCATGRNFCRIDEKLYFNYQKDFIRHGLIEISSSGAKRISWNGPVPSKTDSIFSINNQLYKCSITGVVRKFNADSKKFEKVFDRVDIYNGIYHYNGNLIYSECDLNDHSYYLTEWNGKTRKRLVNEKISHFYQTDDNIFYIVPDRVNTCVTIKKYNLINKHIETVCQVEQFSVLSVIIENNYIILEFLDHGLSIGAIDLENLDDMRILASDSPNESSGNYIISSYNVFDGSIYLSTNQGLKKINIKNSKSFDLVDGDIFQSYIVDDKWIYYTMNNDCSLWRISQDLKIKEKVYG